MQNNGPRLHWDLTEKIIGIYHQVHYEFGNGFLEKLCQRAMVIGLRDAGLAVQEQVAVVIKFRGQTIGECFFDIVVNGLVIVEVKSCPKLEPRHRAQGLNYLRASTYEVALLFNFGPTREWDRLIYTNDRKITLAQADALRTL
jgi:GxxExxY protein